MRDKVEAFVINPMSLVRCTMTVLSFEAAANDPRGLLQTSVSRPHRQYSSLPRLMQCNNHCDNHYDNIAAVPCIMYNYIDNVEQ